MIMVKRFFVCLTVVLAVAQLLLVMLSWMFSAMMADGVHSLLSSEGIRWFVGQFSAMLATEVVSWLLLMAMAGGCLWQSGLLTSIGRPSPSRLTYRELVALRTVVVMLVLYVAVVLALTVIPHAVLLSATGKLVPSAFSRALVPIASFGITLLSAVYGLLSGRYPSLGHVVSSLSYGIQQSAPLFVVYVLAVQLIQSMRFVFG